MRIQQVRPQVESIHTCWIDDETAEVSARVRYGRRSRAVAVRFEQRAERWQAVALEFAWRGRLPRAAQPLARAVRPVGPPGAPWHFLNFLPEPQGHASFRPAVA